METTTTVMEAVTTAITNIVGVATTLLDTITANPILMLFFCVPIVGIGVGVIHRLRG